MRALRRAVIVSVLLHAVVLVIGAVVFEGKAATEPEIVDIEVAPVPREVEALPPEVARKLDEAMAATQDLLDKAAAQTQTPVPDGEAFAVDAGVPDAPPDAPPDASPDAAKPDAAKPDARPRPDAPIDAPEPMVAGLDGGVDPSDAGVDAADLIAVIDAATDADPVAGVDAADPIAAISDAGGGSAAEALASLGGRCHREAG